MIDIVQDDFIIRDEDEVNKLLIMKTDEKGNITNINIDPSNDKNIIIDREDQGKIFIRKDEGEGLRAINIPKKFIDDFKLKTIDIDDEDDLEFINRNDERIDIIDDKEKNKRKFKVKKEWVKFMSSISPRLIEGRIFGLLSREDTDHGKRTEIPNITYWTDGILILINGKIFILSSTLLKSEYGFLILDMNVYRNNLIERLDSSEFNTKFSDYINGLGIKNFDTQSEVLSFLKDKITRREIKYAADEEPSKTILIGDGDGNMMPIIENDIIELIDIFNNDEVDKNNDITLSDDDDFLRMFK